MLFLEYIKDSRFYNFPFILFSESSYFVQSLLRRFLFFFIKQIVQLLPAIMAIDKQRERRDFSEVEAILFGF